MRILLLACFLIPVIFVSKISANSSEAKHEAKAEGHSESKPEGHSEGKAEGKSDGKSEGKEGKSAENKGQKTQKSSENKPEAKKVVKRQVETHVSALTSCLVNENAMNDLKKAREEIAVKNKELSVREADLNARELVITEQISKLEELRKLISKAEEAKKVENEERIAKLVETFLTMSPKAVSKVVATLNDELAVAVLSRIDAQRLAKIMNVMDPKRSTMISEMMVGLNTKGGTENAEKREPASVSTSESKPTQNSASKPAPASEE